MSFRVGEMILALEESGFTVKGRMLFVVDCVWEVAGIYARYLSSIALRW